MCKVGEDDDTIMDRKKEERLVNNVRLESIRQERRETIRQEKREVDERLENIRPV